MNFMVITKDEELRQAAREGIHPTDRVVFFEDWRLALDDAMEIDLMFVDMHATLDVPHRIAGYEDFAQAKMVHSTKAKVPLVLISPEADYPIDYVVGWPGFVYGNVQRPVDYRIFRRASTWV